MLHKTPFVYKVLNLLYNILRPGSGCQTKLASKTDCKHGKISEVVTVFFALSFCQNPAPHHHLSQGTPSREGCTSLSIRIEASLGEC